MPLKEMTCCFTGHRPHKLFLGGDSLSGQSRIKKALSESILVAAAKGYKYFVSGMARGVDMWAAEKVLEIKKSGLNISLVCAVPYRGQPERWQESEKRQYFNILNEADKLYYACDNYTRECMDMRNRLMVDMSSLVIAVYDGRRGGTKNTIDYAIKRGRKIVVIRPGEEEGIFP
ncbi:MAG: SLOG family protein [Christensenellales bacterium]